MTSSPPEALPRVADAALLSVLLDAAPVGFAHYDSRYRFLHVNSALAAANGAPPEAHLGRAIRQIAPGIADAVEALVDDGRAGPGGRAQRR